MIEERDQERQYLLAAGTNGETDGSEKSCEEACGGSFHGIFHLLCYASGQLMLNHKKYELSWPMYCCKLLALVGSFFIGVIFFCLNVGSLAFDLYAVINCPFPNCGFIAGPYVDSKYDSGIEANVTVTGGNATKHELFSSSAVKDKPYFGYQDAVITVATVSGSLSYLIMLYVLVTNYSLLHKHLKSCHAGIILWIIRKCKVQSITADKYKSNCSERASRRILNPFFHGNKDSEEFIPVTLNAKQLFCFYVIFFGNFVFFVASVVTLFHIHHQQIDRRFHKNWQTVDYVGLSAQLASQYCAIISCFIFSKVAYAISLRCNQMLNSYQETLDEFRQRSESEILTELEKRDTEYVQLCHDSMKPYRFWFSVHWFMYALTAFMSIAYLVDTILDYKHDFKMRYIIIIYVFLFTLEHIVLFMYPCFRAASILEARNALIHKVSLKNWPPGIKSKFLQFMKEQRCGFMLSLVCIRVEFGFNIAYISIFFGFIGIVIKVFSLT